MLYIFLFALVAFLLAFRFYGRFLDRKFDVIIGADVLYEKRFFMDLYQFIQHHLISGGFVLFAEPQRKIAKDFFKGLPSEKWIRSVLEKKIRCNDRLVNININIIQAC